MSVFDLDQKGQASLAEEARYNPMSPEQIKAGALDGVGTGIGMGVMRGGAKVGQFIGMAGAVVPMAIDKIAGSDNMSGETLTNQYFEKLDTTVNKAVDYWTPTAGEVGKLGHVLGGLSEIALPLMAGGGNPTLMIGAQEMGTAVDLTRQGVDSRTAVGVGLAQGASAAVGFKMPFLGNTLATRMASGAGGNLVSNMGAAAIQHNALTQGGYEEQAKQFDPLNGEARAIDVLTGIVFGGIAHAASPKITPTQADAVLAASNAKHFQYDTAPGMPADAAASARHQSALDTAVEQLARGEKVNVADSITEAEFVRRPPSQISSAVREAYGSNLPVEMRWAASDRLAQMPAEARRSLRFDDPALNEFAASVEQKYGLPGGLINALKNAGEKSNSTQVSPAGARGVMQFMPENLKKYGVTDASDPAQIIDAAGRYLTDTMKQYGGNIDAVIADYNGGPRQARRVMNGEAPKAAETQAYLQRVRDYLGRAESPAREKQPTPEAFAASVGRSAEFDPITAKPVFKDGTAYTRDQIVPFFDEIVAGRTPTAPLPDVMFRIGKIDETTAQGLREFLPGFNENLREARISADSIQHINDSRPAIAREILQKLDDGVLYADEVLPNPKHPDRALVVLRDAGPTGEQIKKHVSSVIEVAANGKGIDVVTAMTTRDGSLKEARKLKQEIQAGKVVEARSGGAAYPSSSLADSLANQPHAAADFPTVAQDLAPSIDPAQAKVQSVEHQTARQIADTNPDIRVVLDDGTEVSAREALAQAADDMKQAETDSHAFMAAVTCYLRNL